MSFVRFVALRYLHSKHKEGFINVVRWFSMLGIALGVGALIVVMAVMNGFREELITKIASFDGSINIRKIGSDFTNYKEIINMVTPLEGVEFVIPIVEEQALISANNKNLGILVRGIVGEDAEEKSIFKGKLIAGGFHAENPESLIIGRQLADKLYTSVGDKIKILSPAGKVSVLGNIPNSKNFELSGIFDVGMSNYNNDFAFMNLEIAQKLFNLKEAVSYIEIYINEPSNSETVVDAIKSKIGNEYLVMDWKSKNATFFNALKTERVAMFTILTLIIMVASFNIVSSLTMLVKDKTADIAILKTMGATRRDIILIFTIIGVAIGLIGTLLGMILGVSFALNIDSVKNALESLSGVSLFDPLVYFLSFMPSKIEYPDVAKICLMSLSLSILSTIYPTLKAASLDPVDALRYK